MRRRAGRASGARSSAACSSPRTGPALESSVCGEITVLGGHEFYDFEAKYIEVDDVTRLDVPADLPDDVAERVRAMAVRRSDALDCEGFARVDFFVGADGSVTVNELNTIPGFTPVSMFPLLWAASGVPYPDAGGPAAAVGAAQAARAALSQPTVVSRGSAERIAGPRSTSASLGGSYESGIVTST